MRTGMRKVRIDALGIVFHTIPSLILSVNPASLVAVSLLLALYQYIDYSCGEDPEEVRGDIVEFAAGVVLGVLLRVANILITY